MLVFEKREIKPEHLEKKPLKAGYRTNNKLNPHLTLGLRIEPGSHYWETSSLTTAPSLRPNVHIRKPKRRFTRYDFVAYNKLATGL